MSRADRLAAVFTAAYAVTRWAQDSNRLRAAVTALRGRPVVYRARFDGGVLTFSTAGPHSRCTGRTRGFVAESSWGQSKEVA